MAAWFADVPVLVIAGIAVLAWLGAQCAQPELDKAEKLMAAGDDAS